MAHPLGRAVALVSASSSAIQGVRGTVGCRCTPTMGSDDMRWPGQLGRPGMFLLVQRPAVARVSPPHHLTVRASYFGPDGRRRSWPGRSIPRACLVCGGSMRQEASSKVPRLNEPSSAVLERKAAGPIEAAAPCQHSTARQPFSPPPPLSLSLSPSLSRSRRRTRMAHPGKGGVDETDGWKREFVAPASAPSAASRSPRERCPAG